MAEPAPTLTDPNLAYLDAELRLLALRLEGAGESEEARNTAAFLSNLRIEAAARGWVLHGPRLAAAFQLNDFERQLLLLAAAPELDPGFGERIAHAQDQRSLWPTVALAWRLFATDDQSWLASRDSLRQDAPLFRFDLVRDMGADTPLGDRVLRTDPRVADALLGQAMPDARLTPYIRQVALPDDDDADSAAERLGQCIAGHVAGRREAPLIVFLYGSPVPDLERFAAQAVRCLRLPLLAASGLPTSLAIPFVRESMLLPAPLFLADVDVTEWARILTTTCPLILLASESAARRPASVDAASWLPVEVPRPSAAERISLWSATLAEIGIVSQEAAASLADSFALSATEIKQAAQLAVNQAWLRGAAPEIPDVLEACRAEAQHSMTALAQRLQSRYGWDDLVLPTDSADKLRELCGQVRTQHRVLEEYGFSASLARGRGVTALFSGPSGTGKTMAAEVIARELQRELYRVDLARVVSKYIGESEKNLRQIFLEAERARCVVLFDEADALFGKRTDVRDSHDRYANIEVSYLLQLIEESEEAVILLASNRREAIDDSFLRRFRFIVDFPLPEAELRRELWRRSFPPNLEAREISFDALAERLPVSGGNIRNIALGAAFLAAGDGGVVNANLIARAARRELEKLGRPAAFVESEFAPRKGAR
jgi:hypothetical protein